MKSPFFFIVKPIKGKRYNNSKKIGGIDFITSTSEENHKASNREGIVVSTPLGYTETFSLETNCLFIIMFLNFIMI